MTTLETIGQIGTDAVRRLRLQKFGKGLPFMINSGDLPSDQCYLEFPDGNIKLAQLDNLAVSLTFVRTLSIEDEQTIRKKYNFARL